MFRLSLKIARRYLVGKKTTNAINIMSFIALIGIMVGSAAFIIIMSVFNGFEDFVSSRFTVFYPSVKIEADTGKVFMPDTLMMARLKAVPGVDAISATIEEIALFGYDQAQTLGTLKGVDDDYLKVAKVDSMVKAGFFSTYDGETNQAVVGNVIAAKLLIPFSNQPGVMLPNDMTIYMAKRGASATQMMGFSLTSQPFSSRRIQPVGYYEVLQDFGSHVITNIEFVRELLDYRDGEVSALEINLKKGVSVARVQRDIQKIMGKGYKVLSRRQQDPTFYKVTNLERWVGYAILCFAFLIVAFNMTGALAMLVIEKRRDIAVLKSMGAKPSLIRSIFLSAGILLSVVGTLIGFGIAIGLCTLQQRFGFIQLEGAENGNFLVNAYPVSLRAADFIPVFFTIIAIGIGASWLPASRAASEGGMIREE